MTKGITLFDHQATRFANLTVETVASGFQFTEGPLWHPDGYLLFSDTPANRIYRLHDGKATVFAEPSGFTSGDTSDLSDQVGSNGLTFSGGTLLICQHGDHCVAEHSNGSIRPLISSFEGRPLNSPNDIVVSKNGTIFFSDPPYGLKDQVLHPDKFQKTAAVYSFIDEKLSIICSELHYPNGLTFSPGEEFLYISTNHPDEPRILKYKMEEGQPGTREVFMQQNADGMTTDAEGNLYMATNDGVLVADKEGHRLVLIPLDETPTNLAWEGNANDRLYVTAGSSIFLISF